MRGMSTKTAGLPRQKPDASDREACLAWWQVEIGMPPPRYVSVEFLKRVMAYEMQVRAYGGHGVAVRSALKAAIKEEPQRKRKAGERARPSAASLRPGTVLVREWQGRTHRVEVTDAGFELNGRVFPSLSAVANAITGAIWSGPRFFGLSRR